jgi:hypothetical protein
MIELLILCGLATLVTFFALLNSYKKYCVDELRQRIFHVRDDLFDYASQGHIGFDNVAYMMTRTYLNGSIRFAERMTLVKLIVGSHILKHYKSSFDSELKQSLKTLNPEQRGKIEKSIVLSVEHTITYLAKKNFLVITIFTITKILGVCYKLIRSSGVSEKLEKKYKETYTDAIYFEGTSSSAFI